MIAQISKHVCFVGDFIIKNISPPRKEYCITALAILALASFASVWTIKKNYFSAEKILPTLQLEGNDQKNYFPYIINDQKIKLHLDLFNKNILHSFTLLEMEMLNSKELLEIKFCDEWDTNKNKKYLDSLFKVFFTRIHLILTTKTQKSELLRAMNCGHEYISLTMHETLSKEIILLNKNLNEIVFKIIKQMHKKIIKNNCNFSSKPFTDYHTNMEESIFIINDELWKVTKQFENAFSFHLKKRYEKLEKKNKALIIDFLNSENFDCKNKIHTISMYNYEILKSVKSVEQWTGKIRDELNRQTFLFAELGMVSELDKLLKKEKTLFVMMNIWMLLKLCVIIPKDLIRQKVIFNPTKDGVLQALYSNRKMQCLNALKPTNSKNDEDLEICKVITDRINILSSRHSIKNKLIASL